MDDRGKNRLFFYRGLEFRELRAFVSGPLDGLAPCALHGREQGEQGEQIPDQASRRAKTMLITHRAKTGRVSLQARTGHELWSPII
jgi:hypothetical protein